MPKSCPKCRSTSIENDSARGNSICTNCGLVLEENQMVAEVTFQDSTSSSTSGRKGNVLLGSKITRVGQFVPMTSSSGISNAATTMGNNTYFYSSSLSNNISNSNSNTGVGLRESTIKNGRKKIQSLASLLKLTSHHVEAALRLYTLAVEYNFIQGRKSRLVTASCLYIICRSEKIPVMLLDISDILAVNLYELGGCYLKLIRTLNLQLPVIDPSLYLHKFASKLEFGEKTHLVTMTALRLVSRMNRDWLLTGRRPAGICGASLLMAARIHGFRRSRKEIIDLVRVCDMTLRNRLEEFIKTPAARITLEQFNSYNPDSLSDEVNEEHDPLLLMDSIDLPPVLIKQKEKENEKAALLLANSANQKELEDTATEIDLSIKSTQQTRLPGDIDTGNSKYNAIMNEMPLIFTPSTTIRKVDNFTDDIDYTKIILEGLDEEELDSFILSPGEKKEKEQLWYSLNKDYIESQEQKKRIAEEQANNPQPKRKRTKRNIQASEKETAADAAMRALTQKRISQKINFDTLRDLFNSDPILRNDNESKHVCKIDGCSFSFLHEDLFSAHLQTHNSSISSLFQCPRCSIKFSPNEFNVHLRSHDTSIASSGDNDNEFVHDISLALSHNPSESFIEDDVKIIPSEKQNKIIDFETLPIKQTSMPPPRESRLSRLNKSSNQIFAKVQASPLVKPLPSNIVIDGIAVPFNNTQDTPSQY